MQGELVMLREELTGVNGALAVARTQIEARDTELRTALDRTGALELELASQRRQHDELARQVASADEATAGLHEELLQRNGLLAKAEGEASNAQVWLRRALEESAEYKKSLSEQHARLAELEELVNTYRAELEERPAAPRPETTEGPKSAQELAAVLQVTEEAVIRVMESTKARADEALRSIDLDRERIGREVENMTAWRDQAAPMISTLQATMDDVVAHANEIGVRVNEVLRPVTGAVNRLSSQLSSLDALSGQAQPAQPASSQAVSGHEGARVIELRDDPAAKRER